ADQLPVLLGRTAADDQQSLRVGVLELLEMAQSSVEAVVGVLTDRAGVDEDNIGGFHIVGGSHAVELEQPGDALGVVLVHLTAESPDQVSLSGSARVAARRVAPPRRG